MSQNGLDLMLKRRDNNIYYKAPADVTDAYDITLKNALTIHMITEE